MSRGLMIIPTVHPDVPNLHRLVGLANDAELRPHVVWQGPGIRHPDTEDDLYRFQSAGLPGEYLWGPAGKGGAIKSALDCPHGALRQPWLVVDGDLQEVPLSTIRAALSAAEAGVWARGRFDTYGRLTAPLGALLVELGYCHNGNGRHRERAHLWTSGVQAYPGAGITPRDLHTLPDGYGWDVAAALLMHDRLGQCHPIPAGPRVHRETDRAHLARVLAEVARTLGEEAPAWSE